MDCDRANFRFRAVAKTFDELEASEPSAEVLAEGRIVADAVPGVAPVRELTGLAAYRAERWNMAKIHLRAHFTITGDAEHLPLVMDLSLIHI